MTVDNNDNASSSGRREQLDEILADLMRAIDSGEAIDPAQWLRRHADFATELRQFFEKNERLEKLVRPLRGAAARVLHVRCPHCHNPIELLDQAPLSDISCPSCGSSFSLIGDGTASRYPLSRTLGHFELLDRVGTGQFGSVWKARDLSLDRMVAIKIPRNEAMDSVQTEMFFRDARAAAQLTHPHIVSVHEVGKQDDTVYIVSDFVQGMTLKQWMEFRQLTLREAATLCNTIAEALHHAHQSGVIHRDLKPSNVMVDQSGEPHLVDFGLAKREAGEITMTVEGQIVGTPAYMSPEQARGEGHRVDCRADVYSLGVILFELLTGVLPFRGDKQMLIVQILEDEPPSPRKLNSAVPRELETICLRCLEKSVQKRYPTAQQVADDLDRWLDGRPILARPASALERAGKWVKRKPAISASIAVALTALLLLMTGLSVSNVLIRNALDDRTVALRELSEQEGKTATALADRTAAYGDLELEQQRTKQALGRERKALGDLSAANDTLKKQALTLEERQRKLFGSMVKLAHAQALGNHVALADKNLETVPEELRGWEWRYAKRLCHPDVFTRPGQQSVLTADGTHIVMCVEDRVQIRKVPTGEITLVLNGHTADIQVVVIDSSGKWIASAAADHTVKFWDAHSGQCLLTIEAPALVHDLAFDPDAKHLAGGCEDAVVRIWETETGQVLQTFGEHPSAVTCIAYSPDGRNLISGSAPKPSLKVWDVDAGTEQSSFQDLITFSIGLEGKDNSGVHDVVFSPDGETMAIADADLVRLVDATTFEPLKTFAGHVGGVHSVAFRSDGRWLATGSADGTVRVWDVETATSLRILPWHSGSVRSVAFGRADHWLVSASNAEVKLWDLSPDWVVTTLPMHTDAAYALAFSRDGHRLVTGGGRYSSPVAPSRVQGEVRVWDVSKNEILFSRNLDATRRFGVLAVALNEDGSKVAVSGSIGTRVWNVVTGEQLLHLTKGSAVGEVWSVNFSPDQKQLITSSRSGTMVWDLTTGEFVERLDSRGYAQFSPGGSLLATVEDSLHVWDFSRRETLFQTETAAWRLDFSPDGSRIVVGLDTRFGKQKNLLAQIVDARTGEVLAALESDVKRNYHEQDYISGVYDVSFSPDGRRIATASGDKTVRIWDAENGQELLILDHPNQVFSVEFSPDGKRLASGSGHWSGPRVGEVRIWNAF